MTKAKMQNSSVSHKFFILLKRDLSILLKQSSTYISFLLLTLITGIYFFIFTGFFTNQTVDLKYFFSIFPYICILAIPCLSFNIFKKENIFDSISINDFYKIFSKWLSAFIVFAFSIFVSFIIPLLINLFGNLDFAQIFTGYLSILFYGLLVIALSIFIQVIIKNKVASLITTVLILFIFNSVHIIPKYINLQNDFLFNFLQNFSFAWHYDSASKGILNTKDFCFYLFLGILFLYLAFCFYKRNFDKKFTLKNILIILILIFLLLDSSLFFKKIDLTKSKKYSLTNETEQIVKELSKPITITYAFSPELANMNSQVNEIQDFLQLYSNLSNNINLYFEKVTKDSSIVSKLENLQIEPLQIETENSLNQNYTTVYSAIILETENNYKVIPFAYSTNLLEYLLTSNILALETNKTQSVIVCAGNNLSLENEYLDIIEWLKFSGFTVFTDIKIENLKNTNVEIPLLLLGSSNLSVENCQELENEFFKGRKFFVTTSPNSININTDWQIEQATTPDYFIEMLNSWGIYIQDNFVLDKSCYKITLMTSEYSNEYKSIEYPFWIETKSGIFYWPSAIFYKNSDEISVRQLQKSSKESWLTEIYNTDGNFINTSPLNEKNLQPNLKTQNEYNLACEFSGTFTGLFNTKSVDNKLVLISDQYFASKMINYTNNIENFNLVANELLNLTEKDFLIKLKNKNTDDYSFSKIQDISQLQYLSKFVIFVTAFVPILILISCILFLKIKKGRKW